MSEKATYTHGHHASVLRSHGQRTALNSARFLLPYLKPHMKILDIGCGPGTITIDLATYVPEGHVTGLDMVGDILPGARERATAREITNIDFTTGDANALAYADETFDVVFCHQVLQHVGDPVAVLSEMRRVCKVGGIVAAREADYAVFMWYPELPGLRRWQEVYDQVARTNGGEPNAGRFLHVWARKAGFKEVECSVSSWCFAKPDEVKWWSETWQERAVKSAFAKGATENGFATPEELEGIATVWREWGEDVDAWISIPSAEVVCRR
ncbi:class I SAM-dependent methyltransferase [Aspergillus saccharolyticus JOP 1030-1]|uniref:UbiE/COQ5 methyltransferase n=1 Tax=Aspergillus saccharolyticus JOP 1030-1 TaxID=1450539 RepID=A0A318ZE98_9EURO|nr:UbiE/COQ5 methyltransferase [Aspergillus saccharolyticus JOP 1030-1]PYH43023.1 UbiE/COQ5 methyltransferase [Aspergillus saccharolyticus JOP 1030-1]